jgi:hypothetical protein
MYQKQRGLAMNGRNLAKIYIVENKLVSRSLGGYGRGKKGGSKSDIRLL